MEGYLQVNVGRYLRAYRKAKGLSQEAFAAEVLHKHRTYVGSLERGEENVTLQNLERLAARLNANPSDMIEGRFPG